MTTENKKATFGAGCFWGPEATFREVEGVIETAVGYMGGRVRNPTYEQVCTDRTGHAEVVQVEFDPTRVSYDTLLEVFWEIHDPTTLDRQGPDCGTQYRSAIFYHDEEQKEAAEASQRRLEASGRFEDPIVTQIVPAAEFYPAEEYHQRYYERMGLPNLCAIHVGGRK
jgi:peptide-methionine (S)-S-oxide reductase